MDGKFMILLEDGTLFKDVFIKLGKSFARNNADVYWHLQQSSSLDICQSKNSEPIRLDKKDIYYFTISKNYNYTSKRKEHSCYEYSYS